MKISGIRWKNFKSFYNEYEIQNLDQNLTQSANVVLFGGVNGAGKTTLLESVFLCLYGRNAKNLYPSRGAKYESYFAYLHALLNRGIKETGLGTGNMSVEIFLKEVPIVSNVGRNISIRRHWHFETGKDPVEILEILENGKLIDELDPDEYQDRIQAILPFNVSQFFFFDGEKIQDFASDSDDEFARSLKDVLDINLYSKLGEDIKEVRSRIFKEYSRDAESLKEIKEREVKREGFENQNREYQYEISELKDIIGRLETEVEKIDNETRRITFVNADSRDAYIVEKNRKEQEKETLEAEYVDMAKDHLPFILASNLFDELTEQLDTEKQIQQIRAAQAEVEPKITQIIESVFDNNPAPSFTVTPGIRRYYEIKIDLALRAMFGGDKTNVDNDTIIHNLTPDDAEKVKRFIHALNDGVITVLNQKADKLKQINVFLERIRNSEIRAGSGSDAVQQLFDQKGDLNSEINNKKARIIYLEHEIQENQKRIETLNREITNWESRSNLKAHHQKQFEYCDKMLDTIREFQKRFQASKTAELEHEILFMWNQLNHKPDLIKSVKILPDSNFEVKLFNANGSEVDKTKLSAGEKEIYAIALLWALIQVSGKNLPILIDTPFGRLDSVHRRNLTKNYFPKASHQVILLSQDEEVVGEYYEILKPCIAQELTIKNENGVTTIEPGYPFTDRQ